MAGRDHTLARQLVKGAMERFTAVPRVEHEGDALLIVMGAVLEEVSNGSNSWKTRARQTAPPLFTGIVAAALVIELLKRFLGG